MRSVSYQYGSDRRRRAVSLGLTILAHILIILLLLRLGPGLPRLIKPDRPLLSFDVTQTPDNADTQTTKGETKPKIKQSSGGAPPKPAPPQPVPPKPAEEVPPPPVVPMPATKSLFELGDISKLPRHAEDQAVADTSNPGTGSSAGADSGAAYGPGEGPGGQRLYYAEWYTEPQESQLAAYRPKNIENGSWGLIACKTVPDNRVDNCRTVSESPLGSGIARGLREAAWQFRVRPPRVGGKPMIGAWVRILITFGKDGDPMVRSGRR
jgi:hypothetical protein